jgi:SAM-dependent methyltransferase
MLAALRAQCRRWLTRRLAALPDRRGVKWLLRLQDRLYYFTLGVIKVTEGDSHPRHRVTDAPDFFVEHVRPGDRVLDVGAAYGHNALALAGRAAQVVGIERRPEAVARARRERARANIEYRIGTLTDVPAHERYDVILLGNVLEHIADRPAFLAECRSRGRRLIVRVPAADRDWVVPYRQELGLPWKLHPDHEIEYTTETLTRELEQAGFVVGTCFSRYGALHAVAEVRSS